MSFTFILGNLLGRALVSFALVFIICLLASRFDLHAAWRRSKRWYSMVAVTVLTLLGMGGAIVNAGGLQ